MSTKVGITAEDYQVKESVERSTSDAVTGLNKQQEESDGLKIEGMALPFGKRSRNGVVYEKESVEQAAESLVGCSLLFNHDKDNPIGHIKDVKIKENGLYYIGDLNEDKRETDSLKRGDIPHVSIQATIKETMESETQGKVAVDEFLEMSAVTIPGFSQTDVETEETVMIEKLVEQEETESIENKIEQADYKFETGDWVQWEFGDGTSQGKITDRENEPGETLSASGNEREATEEEPVYKMDEWDEEEGELTNDVVKSESELSEIDDPRESQETTTSKEPFQGFDDFEDCVSTMMDEEGHDRESAEKICGAIKKRNEIKKVNETLEDVDLTPPDRVKNAAQAALDWEEENPDRQDCGTGVGDSRANSITNETLSPEDFLGGEKTAIPDYLESHEEDVTAEGPPTDWSDEEMNDCGNRQYAKWGFHFDWFKQKEQELQEAKEEAKNNINGDTVTEKEQNTTTEQLEQIEEDDFTGTVADMYEEVSASDAASLMEDFTFNSNPEPVIALAADAMDMQPADLMDMVEGTDGNMDDEEDEGGDMDDDEDDMEESNTESESSDINQSEQNKSQDGDDSVEEKSKEELKEQVEELQEAVMKLEGTEPSKQEAANTGSESSDDSILSDEFKNRIKR